MQITNYNFNQTEISAIIVDTYAGNYLWLSFIKSGNYCILKKVSANNPLQTYFSIEEEINAFKKFVIYSTSIYTAIDDTIYIGKRYSLLNPLTTTLNFNKPIDANEAPIDIQVTSNFVFFLLPGNISGEHTKIYKFTLSGAYVETINLLTVQNVSSFVVIDNTNIWAVTNTSPTELVKIYNDGSWNYETF